MSKLAYTFLFIIISTNSYASSKTPAKVIAGWVEKISVEKQDTLIKAKLDTGAKTSSIYATNIEFFKKDNDNWVRFNLVLKDILNKTHTLTLEKPQVRRVKIKNHDGVYDRRAVVMLGLCFDGRYIEAEFTLADRKEYLYGVLLGRDFLKGRVIVDSDQTFLTFATSTIQQIKP